MRMELWPPGRQVSLAKGNYKVVSQIISLGLSVANVFSIEGKGILILKEIKGASE